MSLPYIKLENEESVNAKRNILSSEINVLNLLVKTREYKKLRKSELAKKSILRTAVRQEITRINLLLNELPEVEGMPRKKEIKITEAVGKEKSLEFELEQIKRKLESL